MMSKELIREAEMLESQAKTLRAAASVISNHPHLNTASNTQTRAEQLKQFINDHGGAATRQEIIAGAGIPAGTVASLLGSKKKFRKDQRGFWNIKGPEKNAVAAEAKEHATAHAAPEIKQA